MQFCARVRRVRRVRPAAGPAALVEQMAWSHINQGQQLALDNTPPFVIDSAKFGYAQYEVRATSDSSLTHP